MTSVLRIDNVLNGSFIVGGELELFLVMMFGLVGIFVGPLLRVARQSVVQLDKVWMDEIFVVKVQIT